jgi:hypothetical protein
MSAIIKPTSKQTALIEKWQKAWFPLLPKSEQIRLITEQRRFKIVPAGRRSGKTARAKRHVSIEAMNNPGEMYAVGAPTHLQVKTLYWKDLLALNAPFIDKKLTNVAERKIVLVNGAEIHVLGLDKPERWEGSPWAGIVIDEIANCKASAWEENLKPSLNTTRPGKPLAWAWLIGVPEGLNHYYDIAMHAKSSGDADYGYYSWLSSEVLSQEELDKERARMSPRIYRQEYEASFETVAGRIYDDYGDLNLSTREFDPSLPILWCHDFNFTPLSSVIVQFYQGKYYCVDEIVLEGAVARQSMNEFVDRYKQYPRIPIDVYGDRSGRDGEKHGHRSDYLELVQGLKQAGFINVNLRVPQDNPAIRDRQNEVRAWILNGLGERRLLVNKDKCKTMHKGLSTVQLMDGSTFEEKESKSQHITTAIGYMLHFKHKRATTFGNAK